MIDVHERAILDSVDPWKLYDWDAYLSQTIGSRMSGTEGDRKAIAWMEGNFRAFGLTTELDHFNTLSWEFHGAELTVGPPLNKTYPTRAAYYSYATSSEGVEGELVFVGKGTEEEFAAADVAGAQRTGLVRAEVAQRVEGALAEHLLHSGQEVWGRRTGGAQRQPRRLHSIPLVRTLGPQRRLAERVPGPRRKRSLHHPGKH